jgi:hypothetical protein
VSQHYLEIKQDSPPWYGDLDDDCCAKWKGLRLRAEWMDGEGTDAYWWWAVSIIETNEILDSSYNHSHSPNSGEEARKCAEAAARGYYEKTYSAMFQYIS